MAGGCGGSSCSDAHVHQQLKPGRGESGLRHQAVPQVGRAEGLLPTPGWAHGAVAEVPHGWGAAAPIWGAYAEEGSLHESLFLLEALTALRGVAAG